MKATRLLVAALTIAVFSADAETIGSTAWKDPSDPGNPLKIYRSEAWENNALPGPGYDYLMTNSMSSAGVETSEGGRTLVTFPGDSLTMRQEYLVNVADNGNRWLNYPGPGGLVLERYSSIRYWYTGSENRTVNITGSVITVRSTVDDASAPTFRTTSKAGCTTTFAFHLPFVGAADTQVYVDIYKGNYIGASNLEFHEPSPDFLGTIKLMRNSHSVTLCGCELGGTVRLVGQTSLTFKQGETSNACRLGSVTAAESGYRMTLVGKASAEIGSLTFKTGAIEFSDAVEDGLYVGGRIDVTTGLALAATEPIEIRVPGSVFAAANATNEIVLLTAPESAGSFDEDDFKLVVTGDRTTVEDDVEMAVTLDPSTRVRRLTVRRKYPLVFLLSTDSSTTHGSSFLEANATNWSDHLLPHEGADYVVPASFQLMTENPSSTFRGHTLIVHGTLAVCGSNFFLGDESRLVLIGGSHVVAYGTPGVISGGKVEIRKGSSASESFIDGGSNEARTPQIDSELVGNWDLMFRHGDDPYSHEKNPFRLGGLNTNFLGRILTGTTYGGWKSGQNAYVFAVNDPRNLGGTLPSVEYSALKLTEAVRLRPTQSMSFTDVTRGVWIAKASAITVPEGTETDFCQPCTWQGELVKDGAGTLGLGGDLWFFTDTRTKEPPANGQTNRLSVAEGWVKPLAQESCDGLAITFGAGAGIRLTCGLAADDPVRTYGIYDVKWATPIATTSANATIPVAFDGERPVRDEAVGVVTVRDRATADALIGRFTWTKTDNMNGTRVTFAVRDNDDGTATVVATVERTGLMLILR